VTLLAHTTGASASELHKHSTGADLWRALITSVVLPGDETNLQSMLGHKLQVCAACGGAKADACWHYT